MPKTKVNKREVRGKKPVVIDGADCLICWQSLAKSKVLSPRTSTRFQSIFDKLCPLLGVDLSNSAWDFSTEVFPFCPPCFKEIEALVGLQEKLVAIQTELEDGIRKVKNQLSESDHKFVSTDLRIIQFRSQALGDPEPSRNDQCFDDLRLVEVQVDYDQTNTGRSFSADEDEEYEDSLGMVDNDNDEDYEPEQSYSSIPRKQQISINEPPNVTKESRKRKSSPQVEEPKEIESKKLKIRETRNSTRKSKNTDQKRSRSKEYFTPLKTTKDGKIFYENIEIAKNDIGYVCGLCGWMCRVKGHSNVTLRKTKIHIKAAHLDAYKCEICSLKFSSNDYLNSHSRTVHETGKIPCHICLRLISSRTGHMDGHLWTHKKAEEKAEARALGLEPVKVLQRLRNEARNPYRCPKCSRSFALAIELTKHLNFHSTQEANGHIQCPICNKLLHYNNSVREHMKTHPQKVTMIPKYPCPSCHKKYFFRSALDDHIARVHSPIESKPFGCTICNQKFILEKEFQYHLKNHKPIEYYTVQCNLCDLRLKNSKSLQAHRQIFHRDRPIVRPIKVDIIEVQKKLSIDKSDSNEVEESNRRKDFVLEPDGSLRINRDERMEPFETKAEDGKLYFKGYEVSKLEQGGVSCVTCSSEFKKNPNPKAKCSPEKAVKHHIIVDHLGGYACIYCDRKFKTQADLTSHKHVIHFLFKTACEVCGKELDRREYKRHLWTHKNQEDMAAAINIGETIPWLLKQVKTALHRKVEESVTFKCGDCPEAFSSVIALDDHRLQCHLESIMQYRKNKRAGVAS